MENPSIENVWFSPTLMLTRSIISITQSHFHNLHELWKSKMEPKNSESSVRRMRRSRFFCEKRRGCLRASFVCRGGVGDSEVLYRLIYHVNLIYFNLPGKGGCRPRNPPPDTHILIRDNLKRQYFKFFILVFFRVIVQEATINDRVEAPSRQTRSEIVLSLFAILFILEDKITLCL